MAVAAIPRPHSYVLRRAGDRGHGDCQPRGRRRGGCHGDQWRYRLYLAPTVTFTTGGGSGATGTATIVNGAVIGVTLTNGGSGYTSAPTVNFTGGGGRAEAAGTAVIGSAPATAFVAGVTITSGGFGEESARVQPRDYDAALLGVTDELAIISQRGRHRRR